MEYGTIIDDYDPKNELVYSLITEYFNNPMLTKIKDVEGHSLYIAKIDCLLYTENRYIMVFIQSDRTQIGTVSYLKNLKWKSFQTRTLSENHNIKPFQHTPNKNVKFKSQIMLKQRDQKQTSYTCEDYPIIVTLLSKGNSSYEYASKGTLVSALETWRTIISFRE
jgi:hypothetical protein